MRRQLPVEPTNDPSQALPIPEMRGLWVTARVRGHMHL